MIFGQLESATVLFPKFHAGTRRTLAESAPTVSKICLNLSFGLLKVIS